MIELNLEMAEKAVKAAHEAARKINKPIGVTVVDESGRVVLSSRGDGAGFYTIDTSRAKAMASASFRRSTMDIAKHHDLNPLLWYNMAAVIPGQALTSPGAVPIIRDGRVIGAIGIGGGAPEEDQACALAGATAAVA
jgi:uncharacterized protein GlcG (DUF336 family)